MIKFDFTMKIKWNKNMFSRMIFSNREVRTSYFKVYLNNYQDKKQKP